MYKDHMTLIHELGDYASPKSRITRMIRSGDVIQVRKGIFLDASDHEYSLKSLAAVIYGPSYISFEYALAHYGLIPERVNAITSAVYKKNKNRSFHTPVGDFYYYYLPAAVFPYGVIREEENKQSYLIATPEKALLDMLYKIRGITSRKALTALLFDDWRMDRERILTLEKESLFSLAPMYRKKVSMLFLEWFSREDSHA
jgi:predicted transcriptional regulator of viral defense system